MLSSLSSHQKQELNRVYEETIEPGLLEILNLAKTPQAQEVCVFLICATTKNSLSREEYEKLLKDFFGNSAEQSWIHNRLLDLKELYASANSAPATIHHLISTVFSATPFKDASHCSPDDQKSTLKRILKDCKERMFEKIQEIFPEIYAKIIESDFFHKNQNPPHREDLGKGPQSSRSAGR